MQVLYNCEHIFAEIVYINSPLWLALEGLYTREYSNSKRGPSLSLCLREKNSVALKVHKCENFLGSDIEICTFS